MLTSRIDFFVRLIPFVRYRGAKPPRILGTSQHGATFLLPVQRWLVIDIHHIWQPGRCDRGVTLTVTLDDLDLLL